jgi:hypothetical protein
MAGFHAANSSEGVNRSGLPSRQGHGKNKECCHITDYTKSSHHQLLSLFVDSGQWIRSTTIRALAEA